MIIDRLENASLYSNLSPRVSAALTYLRDTDFASTEPGHYDIQGDEIYALVQDYTTRLDPSWHAKFLYAVDLKNPELKECGDENLMAHQPLPH